MARRDESDPIKTVYRRKEINRNNFIPCDLKFIGRTTTHAVMVIIASSPKAIGFEHFRPENAQKKSSQSCKSCLYYFL
jgi:hypothetical protein